MPASRAAGTAIGTRLAEFLCGPGRPALIMLLGEETAEDGHQSRGSAGRRRMAADDTRFSVIVGVRQNDPERWREFDAIYRPMLFAYLRKRKLSDSDANDIVQEIFVKLLAKIDTYDRSRCKFRSWLFSVAHNTLIDHARRRATQQKAEEEWVGQTLKATPADSKRMADEWINLHRERIFEHALNKVRELNSSKLWACFEQRLLQNRPAAEIAEALDIRPAAVYTYASRVLKQVRAVCEAFDEDISHAFGSGVSRGS
jgi:RNA polymerase sigma-70 factor (ECF subfamily)